MRLRDITDTLKAAADLAHAGEQIVGAIERVRVRGRGGPVLIGLGLGLGVALGALLFSESTRRRLQGWLLGASEAATNGPARADEPITVA
jgi:hypothetical protein